jgi:hypothetical protein
VPTDHPARPDLATVRNDRFVPPDQYLITAMMAATMNAAAIESARSSVFDCGAAEGGSMSLTRRLQFANEPANIAGLHWI